jgi:hypothetical protein
MPEFKKWKVTDSSDPLVLPFVSPKDNPAVVAFTGHVLLSACIVEQNLPSVVSGSVMKKIDKAATALPNPHCRELQYYSIVCMWLWQFENAACVGNRKYYEYYVNQWKYYRSNNLFTVGMFDVFLMCDDEFGKLSADICKFYLGKVLVADMLRIFSLRRNLVSNVNI